MYATFPACLRLTMLVFWEKNTKWVREIETGGTTLKVKLINGNTHSHTDR